MTPKKPLIATRWCWWDVSLPSCAVAGGSLGAPRPCVECQHDIVVESELQEQGEPHPSSLRLVDGSFFMSRQQLTSVLPPFSV